MTLNKVKQLLRLDKVFGASHPLVKPTPATPARKEPGLSARSTHEHGVIPTPRQLPSPTPCCRTALYQPRQHAFQLVSWFEEKRWSGELVFADMLASYWAMCVDCNWAVRPWNPVAREFTKLTTGRKVYRWFRLSDGKLHRLRVYPIGPPKPKSDSPHAIPAAFHVARPMERPASRLSPEKANTPQPAAA